MLAEIMADVGPGALALLVVGLILALAGAINTVGSAVEKVVHGVQAARAPDKEQDDRIEQLENDVKDIKKKLEKDHNKFESLDSGNRVTQQALLALLDHGIDGNNIEQMQHAKEALQTHLINRK